MLIKTKCFLKVENSNKIIKPDLATNWNTDTNLAERKVKTNKTLNSCVTTRATSTFANLYTTAVLFKCIFQYITEK